MPFIADISLYYKICCKLLQERRKYNLTNYYRRTHPCQNPGTGQWLAVMLATQNYSALYCTQTSANSDTSTLASFQTVQSIQTDKKSQFVINSYFRLSRAYFATCLQLCYGGMNMWWMLQQYYLSCWRVTAVLCSCMQG